MAAVEVQAFALLAALATLSCVASITARSQLWHLVAGMLGGLLLINPALAGLPFGALLAIDAAQVSLLLVLLAVWRIHRASAPLLLLCGGVLAQVWLQALASSGYPPVLAVAVVTAAVVTTVVASLYRPGFRSAALLDEAFLIVLAFGFVMATVPEAMDGWYSAVGLQATDGADAAISARGNILWVVLAFFVIGGVYASWQRRKKSAVNRRT